MRLLLKFNLIFLLIFAAGLAAISQCIGGHGLGA